MFIALLLFACQIQPVSTERARLNQWTAATRALSVRPASAVDSLEALLKLTPDDPVLAGWLAYAYAKAERTDEATSLLLEHPLALTVPENRYNLACYLARQGQTDRALTQLTTLRQRDPALYERARRDADLSKLLQPVKPPQAELLPLPKSVFWGSDLQISASVPEGAAFSLTVTGPLELTGVGGGTLRRWTFRVIGAGVIRVESPQGERMITALAPKSKAVAQSKTWTFTAPFPREKQSTLGPR